MNLLALCQDFCSKWGLPAPIAIIGSTDATYTQLLSLAQEVLEDMSVYAWEQQVARRTWTSIAAEDQGALTTVWGTDYSKLIPATVWDGTLRRPIFGPVGDESWQLLKNFIPGGPLYQYKIMSDHFFINPTMVAGHTLSAMVRTTAMCVSNTGTGQMRFAADTDSPQMPDNVFKSQLEWRWLKQRNEAWAASFQRAQGLLATQINRNNHLPTFWLDKAASDLVPGIWVPAGNWNV